MIRSLPRLTLLVVLPLSLVSCAAGTLVPERASMPAARASLLPEFRIFYDSMVDYGDWILIEPYGYVFRPHVNAVAWRPYEDGFWAPTDVYGWTWISSEPFGWATYHYGNWFYDRFQGWVWVPGRDWGPAWVTWNGNEDYIGWSPQPPRGVSYTSQSPGYSYVPIAQMGSPDLSAKIIDPAQAAKIGNVNSADDLVQIHGVVINRGPSIERIQQKAGPLTRVRIQDLVTPSDVASLREREEAAHPTSGAPKRGGELAPDTRSGARQVAPPDSTRQAAVAAAQQARSFKDRGFVGARVSLVRPFGVPDRVVGRGPVRAPRAQRAPRAPAKNKAARDTTRVK